VKIKAMWHIIFLTSFIVASQGSAFAVTSDSLMCSGGIISITDTASELVRKCGQPSYATQREQKISEEGDFPGERIITTIKIDDWTFNFGPDRLQYHIILKNGRIWSIDSLNYGY
jgi:Protein of unknown function (DUF2845)